MLPHLGAPALGAAGYAARAAGLAAPEDADAVGEIRWQLDRLPAQARAALRRLPRVGEHSAGPLGPGLLTAGRLGSTMRELQTRIAVTDACSTTRRR